MVSSGSTDATDDIVREYGSKDPRMRFLRQEKREGKNSAVNAFMAIAEGGILVMVNADNNLGDGGAPRWEHAGAMRNLPWRSGVLGRTAGTAFDGQPAGRS